MLTAEGHRIAGLGHDKGANMGKTTVEDIDIPDEGLDLTVNTLNYFKVFILGAVPNIIHCIDEQIHNIFDNIRRRMFWITVHWQGRPTI